MIDYHWWQLGIIYQIYPRSFQDCNGDGIGDLRGIIERLDYLVELRVDALWISPIYPSPMADFGYDVAAYCDVDPVFGTLADFDVLVAAIHERGLKLIVDFVPNHSSDRHPWFVESRGARDAPKHDWYIWHDAAAGGGPPNNWLSHFGGSAWEWNAQRGQYYLHSFLAQQPDLNWRNPDVRAAMYDVMRFWLDRGVDGFRVDVLWLLIKDERLRDNPVDPAYRSGRPAHDRLLPLYTADRPEIHAIVAEMRAVLDTYSDRVLIGEMYLPVERLVTYYGRDLRGAHLPFNFTLIDAPWNAPAIASSVRAYEAALPAGAWPNWVLGNHDKSRIATRVGPAQARVAALLLLTLRGTPTLYYGDEIGMTDVPIAADLVQDPAERNEPGRGFGRDPQRTPMRWDASPNAGFTRGEPWLPLGAYGDGNVALLDADPASILSFYRRAIALRARHRVLRAGSIDDVRAIGNVLTYERRWEHERCAVFLNFGAEPQSVVVPPARVIISTHPDRGDERVDGALVLRAGEALVVWI